MAKKTGAIMLGALIILLAFAGWAQQKSDIPDAPSASQPPAPTPFPTKPPADSGPPPDSSSADQDVPKQKDLTPLNEPPRSAPEADAATAPPPMPPVKTVTEGSVPPDGENSREELFTVTRVLNYVTVPVTVKDNDGRLVAGLLPKDFTVLENGQPQTLKFFTSDPFPLSAAVVFDLGMPDSGVRKIQETLPALQGAFSQFDEVAIYTYSSTVSRVSDFSAIGQQLTAVLNQIKTYSGRNNGAPVTGGPLGPQGPSINGHPVDSPIQPVISPPRQAHVINDAILLAARDLSKRDRTRRKIIFVVSDGREVGSDASYTDTLKVLLKQNIIVYGVGVEGAAIPGYGKLQKVHIPKIPMPPGLPDINFGYGNILPRYVYATGGGTVYAENAKADIEKAYARAIGDARNQYTLAYSGKPGAGAYRRIEVRVRRPDLTVYAKDGYYPLPTPK
ncbi:MAG TPA: VWA domain-containing protein [Terriglobales bacterium]|nr:VWA domain-containing protein [Terriglobales bacterium]